MLKNKKGVKEVKSVKKSTKKVERKFELESQVIESMAVMLAISEGIVGVEKMSKLHSLVQTVILFARK